MPQQPHDRFAGPPAAPPSRAPVSWPEALRVFVRIGLQSFGGPAGQIAVMHRILVEEKRWISETRFLHALNYCMLLPGPEAMQLITYVGWLMHRTLGGIVAGALFVLPGFVSILVLSVLYSGYRETAWVAALFYGVKPAVLAIVVEAVVRIGRRALRNAVMVYIAAAAFLAMFALDVPFPIVVAGAALIGWTGDFFRPDVFEVIKVRSATGTAGGVEARIDTAIGEGALEHTRPSLARALRVLVLWGLLWWAPVAALALAFGRSHVFVQQAVFFSKAAVVTFGGAYAVLSYLAQQAVEVYGWLEPGEMLDGLGMAETTPGPLIQVVQFVGYVGAHRQPGALHPAAAGVLASMLVTWVTYVPCFLWIFLGAPFIEVLRDRRRLTAALSAVTAAVVGVILNLAVWFSLHTLFGEVREARPYGLRLLVLAWESVDAAAVGLAAAAMIALLRFKAPMMAVLGGAALIGVAVRLMPVR